MDLLINGCNPTSITIPTANQALRRSTLNEGVEGWATAAESAVKEAFKTLHTAMDRDELLTLADIRRPHRIQAAAGLLPFISLTVTRRTLGIPETSAIDTSSGLRLMFEYICRWSKSTISGAASAWFRLHWFCKHLKIEESERFSGPVLTAFFGCVAARAKEKAEQHRPNPAARGRKNGTTAETQVRNGLAFIMTNLCVDMPYLRANLVKKMIFSQRILPDPFSAIPIRSMIALERAASGKIPDLPDIVNKTCSMFLPLGLGCLRPEQANCSEIMSFSDTVAGCCAGITDREKDNQPHKMRARPFWLPIHGLLSEEWAEVFRVSTHTTQKAGIFIRENDSRDGDPFTATRLLNRPMERHRMLVCLRALLHRVAGIPLEHLSKYGVSSFRKFLPAEVVQQRGLPADRWQQSRPIPPPSLSFLPFNPPHEQV